MVDPRTQRDTNIERRKSTTGWWIIGVIAVALLVWGLVEWLGDDDVEDIGAVPVPAQIAPGIAGDEPYDAAAPATAAQIAAPMPPPPVDTDNVAVPVRLIVITPADYLGQAVTGTAHVAGVPSDRGFWLEQDGERMFAVIAKSPSMEDAVDVDAGQQVRLSGVVYDASMASQIAGGLDDETLRAIAGQPAFLLVDARNVEVIDR